MLSTIDACSTATICPFICSSSAGRLVVTANKECRWPEDNDGGSGGDSIFGTLTILCAGERGCPSRDGLSLERKLLAGIALIG
jgi:hypothetical protein